MEVWGGKNCKSKMRIGRSVERQILSYHFSHHRCCFCDRNPLGKILFCFVLEFWIILWCWFEFFGCEIRSWFMEKIGLANSKKSNQLQIYSRLWFLVIPTQKRLAMHDIQPLRHPYSYHTPKIHSKFHLRAK